MVRSILNPTIRYDETPGIYKSDLHFTTTEYQIELFKCAIVIGLGKKKTQYERNHLLWFPVYLIRDGKIHSRIGVYELHDHEYTSLIDPEGDLILSSMGPPLLFSGIRKSYFIVQEGDPDYQPHRACTWIEKALRSNKYTIQDNEEPNSFLRVIEIAMNTPEINIEHLRSLLVESANDSIFLLFKKGYDRHVASIQEMKTQHAQLKEDLSHIPSLHSILSITERQEVMKRKEQLQHNFESLQKKLNENKETPYPFMKKVTNLKEFKKLVSTHFWSETWCIDTLERLLNIKTIVFSQTAYEDEKPFLLCFPRHSTHVHAFKPDHYIFMSYRKPVYKLITYEGRSMHQELPEAIRKIIRREKPKQCLLRLIPEFNQL